MVLTAMMQITEILLNTPVLMIQETRNEKKVLKKNTVIIRHVETEVLLYLLNRMNYETLICSVLHLTSSFFFSQLPSTHCSLFSISIGRLTYTLETNIHMLIQYNFSNVASV